MSENLEEVLESYPINVPLSSDYEKKYIFWASYIDNVLVGKLLTLIDASVVDPRQNKALKDVIRQTVRQWAESTSYCNNCENGKNISKLPVTKSPTTGSDTKDNYFRQHHCPICNMYYDLVVK